jgi:hypothetical protein
VSKVSCLKSEEAARSDWNAGSGKRQREINREGAKAGSGGGNPKSEGGEMDELGRGNRGIRGIRGMRAGWGEGGNHRWTRMDTDGESTKQKVESRKQKADINREGAKAGSGGGNPKAESRK